MAASSDGKPTVVELFAGAGGLMLGLEMAGFESLLANEVHPHPCMTLERNFPDVPIIEASIRELSGQDLLLKAGYDPDDPPEVDLVAGGPPCQGFSTAGLKDKTDPRNTLIGDFIRIVEDLRPRAFLLENVTGLMTMHGGLLFEHVLDELDGLGYKFHYETLFAADYGIPQMRKRLIVLGARDEAPPPHPVPSHQSPHDQSSDEPTLWDALPADVDPLHDDGLPPYMTCGEALDDLPLLGPGEVKTEYAGPPTSDYQRLMREGSEQLHNHESSNHRKATMEYYALVPPGGTALDIPKDKRKAKQGIQRWPLDGLARTITTEPTDFLHPTQHRIPTIRELARIQSFPDRHEFMGQRTTGNKMRRLGYCSQSQQVGNAVPPLLGKAIGEAILSSW